MKRSERYALNEMAAADMEGIDLTKGTPDSIAKQYVDNYKKRTEKEFSAQAAASFKKQLADREDADAIVAAARKYAGVKEAKSHAVRSQESNAKKTAATAEKNDIMAKNVGAAAKAAADVGIKESIMDNIRKNSGLMMITESSKHKRCPSCKLYLDDKGVCKNKNCKGKKKVAEDEGDQEPKASCATDSKKSKKIVTESTAKRIQARKDKKMILISKCDFCGKKNVKGYRGLDPYGNDINGDEEIYSICDVCSKERAADI